MKFSDTVPKESAEIRMSSDELSLHDSQKELSLHDSQNELSLNDSQNELSLKEWWACYEIPMAVNAVMHYIDYRHLNV